MKKEYIQLTAEKKDGKIIGVATDETVDRHGESLDINKWDLKLFKRNPVLQAGHRYAPEDTIGNAVNIRRVSRRLIFDAVFHDITQLAREISAMYSEGFLKTFSVGFIKHFKRDKKGNTETDDQGVPQIKSYELLEISAVPVPANPSAEVIKRGLKIEKTDKNKHAKEIDAWMEQFKQKKIVPFKKHELAAKDQAWDAPLEMKKATVDQLRLMATWFDSDNSDIKAAYKLPHHKALSPNKTVWRGVAAAMGALLGASGGVKIPSSERSGVYNHLAKHYTEFGEKAPDFKDFRLKDLMKMHKKGVIVADERYLIVKLLDYYKYDQKNFDNLVVELHKGVKKDEGTKKKKVGKTKVESKPENHYDEQVLIRALQHTAKYTNLALNKLKNK